MRQEEVNVLNATTVDELLLHLQRYFLLYSAGVHISEEFAHGLASVLKSHRARYAPLVQHSKCRDVPTASPDPSNMPLVEARFPTVVARFRGLWNKGSEPKGYIPKDQATFLINCYQWFCLGALFGASETFRQFSREIAEDLLLADKLASMTSQMEKDNKLVTEIICAATPLTSKKEH